ncbi:1,2-phenylacetyl-CoA epoxidase subunit PaaD [Marinicella sp. W31]|uniref:1,2-phenylacetyl-CoA epoxidase subunit PaaD n=1 Tax=Marinicella sp. W31 TaxID=3023713 RepID=UPI0037579D43
MVIDQNIETVWELLQQVTDPEIPVLSLLDLGVVKDVSVSDDAVTVIVTPTYSACPATFVMQQDIEHVLKKHGFESVTVKVQNFPAWTTDDITQAGRQKLEQYGIAPPQSGDKKIRCPQCQSEDVECISQFGSTACKALYRCKQCLEPFDYFKCHV